MNFAASITANNHAATIRKLAQREVAQRVVGTQLGLLHYVITPISLLSVYTFVFGTVFAIRWGEHDSSLGSFALRLFAGLIAFGFFAEVVNRAPGLVLGNVNYVKKVVFPLEILVPVTIASALVGVGANYVVFFVAYVGLQGVPPVQALWLPVLWLPLVLFSAGIAWLLASLGVYLRDIGQLVGVLMTLVMFLTPIFYPLSMVPKPYDRIIGANPVAFIIEQMRAILFEGRAPDLIALSMMAVVSTLVAQGGYMLFMRSKKGFADVL